MNAPARPPRRGSGGRTLMLLGVLLALAAGTVVILVVSQYTAAPSQTTQVVVAKKDLPAGVILSVTQTDATHILITDAFAVKTVNTDFKPADAYTYTTPEDLNVKLNNYVIVGTFYAGEILRQTDPRVVELGKGAAGSVANLNPAQLPKGFVITQMELQAKPVVVPGDYVDVLVTACNLVGSKNEKGCETQTTLQNVYIYTVRDNFVYVVVSHQDALTLKFLTETGKAQLAIRKPGDTGAVSTDPVTPDFIVKSFKF